MDILESGNVIATSWTEALGVSRGCEKVCPTGEGTQHYGYPDHLEDDEDDEDDD